MSDQDVDHRTNALELIDEAHRYIGGNEPPDPRAASLAQLATAEAIVAAHDALIAVVGRSRSSWPSFTAGLLVAAQDTGGRRQTCSGSG